MAVAWKIEWWRGFDEPDLQVSDPAGARGEPRHRLAGARLDEAKALLRENREEFLPRGGQRSITRPGGAARWKHQRAGQRDIETYRGALDALVKRRTKTKVTQTLDKVITVAANG